MAYNTVNDAPSNVVQIPAAAPAAGLSVSANPMTAFVERGDLNGEIFVIRAQANSGLGPTTVNFSRVCPSSANRIQCILSPNTCNITSVGGACTINMQVVADDFAINGSHQIPVTGAETSQGLADTVTVNVDVGILP